MEPVTIMVVAPIKKGDATAHTYEWANKFIKMAENLGYRVIILRGDDVTYNNVTKTLENYDIRLYVQMSHGCNSYLVGQNECVITKKIGVDEIIDIARTGIDELGLSGIERVRKLLQPLQITCNDNSNNDNSNNDNSNNKDNNSQKLCQLENDNCRLCLKDTNVQLLKGKIIITTACHSGFQLGKCAIAYGAEIYLGYTDLFLFPVDSMRSQDITGDIQLEFLRNLLLGKSVRESEISMRKMEDAYIRMYKKIKYIAVPMRWNQKYRVIHGNPDARIYEIY